MLRNIHNEVIDIDEKGHIDFKEGGFVDFKINGLILKISNVRSPLAKEILYKANINNYFDEMQRNPELDFKTCIERFLIDLSNGKIDDHLELEL